MDIFAPADSVSEANKNKGNKPNQEISPQQSGENTTWIRRI
jgi:hypothetical protein